MSDDQNFADHPTSLGEARAQRTGSGAQWTPRDALIAVLRDIDAGKVTIDALVCAYRIVEPDGGFSTGFAVSAPEADIAVAVMTRGLAKMANM